MSQRRGIPTGSPGNLRHLARGYEPPAPKPERTPEQQEKLDRRRAQSPYNLSGVIARKSEARKAKKAARARKTPGLWVAPGHETEFDKSTQAAKVQLGPRVEIVPRDRTPKPTAAPLARHLRHPTP